MRRPASWFARRKKAKIFIILILLFLIIGSQLAKKSMNALEGFGPKEMAEIPKITHLPWDVDRIYALTPYRSNVGHDYTYKSWDGETCRTLNHYGNYGHFINGLPYRSKPTPDNPNINLYAPFDGEYSTRPEGINPNNPSSKEIGLQIIIKAKSNSHWIVRLYHSDVIPGLKEGSQVKSGQLVGTVGPMDPVQIAYEANLAGGKVVYQSIFEHVTTQAFEPYAKLGFTPSSFVISKEAADAKNYQCVGPGGYQLYVSTGPVACGTPCVRPGYIYIRPDPYPIAKAEGQIDNLGVKKGEKNSRTSL